MARDVAFLYERLKPYLVAGDRLTGISVLSAGHVNETYRLEGVEQILRLPPAGSPLLEACSISQQFQRYAILTGVAGCPPVPRVTHLCEDPEVLGAPFFLMDVMPGRSVPEYGAEAWLSDPPDSFRSDLCRQWIGAMAGLAHVEPLQALGSVRSSHEELEIWKAYVAPAENQAMTRIFDALLALDPRSSGPPSPVQGDAKLANTLWQDGRLSAVLDWEMAFNGDPLNDLGYMLQFFPSEHHAAMMNYDLPGMWDRERVIEAWEAGSGRSARGVAWYEAAQAAKAASIVAYGAHLSRTSRDADPRFAVWQDYATSYIAGIEKLLDKM